MRAGRKAVADAAAQLEQDGNGLLGAIQQLKEQYKPLLQSRKSCFSKPNDDDFVAAWGALVKQANARFEAEDWHEARAAYAALVPLAYDHELYRISDTTGAVNSRFIRDACARFLRAVYELAPLNDRASEVYDALTAIPIFYEQRPGLQELLRVSSRPLPDWETFLVSWVGVLKEKHKEKQKDLRDESDRLNVDYWLREAITMQSGFDGISDFARTEGRNHPRAYLDWLAGLMKQSRHVDAGNVAHAALQDLPVDLPIRAHLLDYVAQAARAAGDQERCSSALWDAFLIKPSVGRLLGFREATPAGPERLGRLREGIERIRYYIPTVELMIPDICVFRFQDGLELPIRIFGTEIGHACVLAESWQDARNWVYGELRRLKNHFGSWFEQPLLLPFFLAVLAGRDLDRLPPNLELLWQEGLKRSYHPEHLHDRSAQAEFRKRLRDTYQELLTSISLDDPEWQDLLPWCVQAVRDWVAAAAGCDNGWYDKRTARLVGALAEVLYLQGAGDQAEPVIAEAQDQLRCRPALPKMLRQAITRWRTWMAQYKHLAV